MKITRETDYAIRCMLYIASQPQKVCYVDDISQNTDAPKSFLAKITQKLVKNKLLISHRGVKGGYILSRPAHEINLLEIIETMQGKISLNQCVMDNVICNRHLHCAVHNVWLSLTNKLREQIASYSLQSLLSTTNQHQKVSLKPSIKYFKEDRYERLSV